MDGEMLPHSEVTITCRIDKFLPLAVILKVEVVAASLCCKSSLKHLIRM